MSVSDEQLQQAIELANAKIEAAMIESKGQKGPLSTRLAELERLPESVEKDSAIEELVTGFSAQLRAVAADANEFADKPIEEHLDAGQQQMLETGLSKGVAKGLNRLNGKTESRRRGTRRRRFHV